MAKIGRKNGSSSRSVQTAKYDAHHNVLEKAYGAFADLRRQLADSKTAVAERTDLLNIFSTCSDSQRAFLLLEDYFEKLSLARKDFPGTTWWPRVLAATGKARLEETALLFLKNNRPLPPELMPHANLERFAEIEQQEQEQQVVKELEDWLLPQTPVHLDAPRACLRVVCTIQEHPEHAPLNELKVELFIFRPRAGERKRTVGDLLEMRTRAAHEQELFAAQDWDFIQWITTSYAAADPATDSFTLSGSTLLEWLARWGHLPRLELGSLGGNAQFHGEMLEFSPALQSNQNDLAFTHHLSLPDGSRKELPEAKFFFGTPRLALIDTNFYLIRNSPPDRLLARWLPNPLLPVSKLSHRLLTHLRRNHARNGSDWDKLCTTHTAIPQFIFELNEETVRLRLLAISDQDESSWQWNGHEWQKSAHQQNGHGKPEILDDPRLEPATEWLRRLDWFTPEPGLWVGDANENFLNSLAAAWPERPPQAQYLGNGAFQRLYLSPRKLRPKLMLQGSGIDWFSVCAAWEAEGLKLSPADLERLQSATGRFVKLPDSGWMELDVQAVQSAHEAFAELGLNGLNPVAQKVDLLHARHMDEATLEKFAEQPFAKALRERVAQFKGIEHSNLPEHIHAELRPYQKDGFDFLCHLSRLKLGGVLADDMGLGKTLQTLSWLSWLRQKSGRKAKPALVICPASVLHNWRREANKFTPDAKVLVLESGSARHNLRKQIPEHDIIVTNYSILRRDLAALQKFDFQAIVLDEAQYIKNPSAQVTQSVKQLKAAQRLALTGTPLENRLLDLWSISDFVQPGYLGSQSEFTETYEPKGENPELAGKLARKRLSAKLRPIMLRRLKKQVAKDLPDRIEERRDCPLGEEQRKLYLAELRRSREQIMQTVSQQGVARSKIHILAALTRLRQICCHPSLVGSDTASGKTDTLFELLEPLHAEGQKVLVFSQFVRMLNLLEEECKQRQITTHILTGETKQRQDVVNAFQNDPNPSVFLLSLRAAGTGLNLTTASYVVLYDPWWNPAVEAQAIDRSHRIGQTRTVNAYKLITPGTVEEKIFDLQQRKAQTIADVLGEEGFARNLTKADLEYLFAED